jgi:signal transduction histidine kinase
MPIHGADEAMLSRVLRALESWLDEGGRTFVRLAIAALLPLLIFGILAGVLAAERTMRVNTRGLAVQLATRSAERISLELDAQIDLSEALAASTALDRGDFDAFRTEAGRLTTLHPLWQGIEVTDAAGKPLFSTSGPAEARLGEASDRNSFQQVLKTGRPSVGGLGPAGLGPPTATLRVPVLRGGVLRYILSLAVVPDAIGEILHTAGAPPGWVGVVVDANGHILARTGDPNEKPGELASLGLLDAIAPGRTGFHEGVTRSGLRIETVTRSLPHTGGWSVAFGIPVSVLQHPVRDALLVLAAIGCGSLALAAGLASFIARDLHRRRAAERDHAAAALRASEARQALAVEAAELGTWRWDVAEDRFEGSARCRAMLDRPPPPSDGIERWNDALAAVHPADRGALDRAVAGTLEGGSLSAEFRVQSSRGGIRWIHASGGAAEQGADGIRSLQGVMNDVTVTKQAIADRQALLRRLSAAQEEERRRLSRELHDQVGQSVTGLSLGLKALERTGSAPLAALQALQALAIAIGRDIHRAAADLRPAALDDLGLEKALAALAAGYAQTAGVRIDVQVVGTLGGLPSEVEILVYRVVQEALNNVLKHANAKSVSMVLERSRAKLRVIVEDDGIGFDPDTPRGACGPPALGLLGMRERLALVGGAITIESTAGAGATLFIDVPLASGECALSP